jgi:hypothetical protein
VKPAVLGLGLALGACADDGGPRLDDVTPASAGPGASVEITGRRFCGAAVARGQEIDRWSERSEDHRLLGPRVPLAGACLGVAAKIELGLNSPIVAMVFTYSDSTATIQIPSIAMPGTTELVLTVDGRSSNALEFEVLP